MRLPLKTIFSFFIFFKNNFFSIFLYNKNNYPVINIQLAQIKK